MSQAHRNIRALLHPDNTSDPKLHKKLTAASQDFGALNIAIIDKG